MGFANLGIALGAGVDEYNNQRRLAREDAAEQRLADADARAKADHGRRVAQEGRDDAAAISLAQVMSATPEKRKTVVQEAQPAVPEQEGLGVPGLYGVAKQGKAAVPEVTKEETYMFGERTDDPEAARQRKIAQILAEKRDINGAQKAYQAARELDTAAKKRDQFKAFTSDPKNFGGEEYQPYNLNHTSKALGFMAKTAAEEGDFDGATKALKDQVVLQEAYTKQNREVIARDAMAARAALAAGNPAAFNALATKHFGDGKTYEFKIDPKTGNLVDANNGVTIAKDVAKELTLDISTTPEKLVDLKRSEMRQAYEMYKADQRLQGVLDANRTRVAVTNTQEAGKTGRADKAEAGKNDRAGKAEQGKNDRAAAKGAVPGVPAAAPARRPNGENPALDGFFTKK